MTWYENEVRELEKNNREQPAGNRPVVFYGSSSIRLWKTLADDFPELDLLNLGFGGSTLAACTWFFDRLVVPANPRSIVFYAGDNDLGDGRHPEEVYLFFCAFAEKLRRYLPDVPLTFLSIKISPSRWNLVGQIRWANQLIADEIGRMPNARLINTTDPLLGADGRPAREYFESDGLHLSPNGYQVWKTAVQAHMDNF
ncbi:lysophospholipase L1-like esterase [Spirosoma lacussanchae]|uniref:GDSL-type esterase/lipase family protein n=1 Tax=Spirosoma lacussanchae TaxID=1884249 RepID=UPI001109AF54|nr:GDSL-type esterase/lipase family protein [Spirosoma lacussanchae]